MQAQVIRLNKCFKTINYVRHFQSSTIVNAGKSWRIKNNLPKYNNEYGPLRDSPDFSFKDGRAIPLSDHQIARKKQQINELQTVIKLLGEIDYSVDKAKQLQMEEEGRRQHILQDKLKPKQIN